MTTHPLRAPVFLTDADGDSDGLTIKGNVYTLDPQTGEPYDPTVSAPVELPKSTTITTAQVSVGTSATLLFNLNADATDRMLRCITADIFIGPAAVTSSTGFLIKAAAEPVRLPAAVGEIYGITASGTATVYTFEQ